MLLKPFARRARSALMLFSSLILLFAGGAALAADQFQGFYMGVYLGWGYNSGSFRHYCFYSGYEIDGEGSLSTGQYRGSEGLGLQYTTGTYGYTLFRREGLLVGPELVHTARAHGRLRADLEAGFSMPMHSYLDWYFGLFGRQYSGPDLDESDLDGDYWTAQSGYTDHGTDQSHWAAFGSETYDGLGTVSVSVSVEDELYGNLTSDFSDNYNITASGGISRDDDLMGFYLDDGGLLIHVFPHSLTDWHVEFAVRKPTPGTCSTASLQGSYWIGYYFVEDLSPAAGDTIHTNALGKMYFDGAGTVVYQVTMNRSDGQDECRIASAPYTVDANGRLEIPSLNLVGGLSPDHHTVVGAGMAGGSTWGIFALLKSSGLEDPSPLCQMLGLTR